MKIRFYTDEHIAKPIIRGLKQRQIDVLTTVEAKMIGRADEEHLQLATRLERVLITQDADFLRLHADGFPHSGIAYAPQRTDIGKIVRGLILIYQVLESEDMQNHLEYL